MNLNRNLIIFFFFQAEDGIRDVAVTGVQTCALPISRLQCYRRRAPARFSTPPSAAGSSRGRSVPPHPRVRSPRTRTPRAPPPPPDRGIGRPRGGVLHPSYAYLHCPRCAQLRAPALALPDP